MTEQVLRRAVRRRRSACRILPVFLLLSILCLRRGRGGDPDRAQSRFPRRVSVGPSFSAGGESREHRPRPRRASWKSRSGKAAQPRAAFRTAPCIAGKFSCRRARAAAVQFTIDPDLLSRPLKIQFTSTAATASRELDLRRHFSPAPVVLTVSDGSAVPLTSLGASLTNRVVALSVAELPQEARALLGVSHLVIYDQSLRDLSRAQVLALDDWLAAGGRMVIIGSLNFTLYQEPQLARYLPVRVTGVTRTAFAAHGSGQGEAIAGVWAQTATVLRGRVVAESRACRCSSKTTGAGARSFTSRWTRAGRRCRPGAACRSFCKVC